MCLPACLPCPRYHATVPAPRLLFKGNVNLVELLWVFRGELRKCTWCCRLECRVGYVKVDTRFMYDKPLGRYGTMEILGPKQTPSNRETTSTRSRRPQAGRVALGELGSSCNQPMRLSIIHPSIHPPIHPSALVSIPPPVNGFPGGPRVDLTIFTP